MTFSRRRDLMSACTINITVSRTDESRIGIKEKVLLTIVTMASCVAKSKLPCYTSNESF